MKTGLHQTLRGIVCAFLLTAVHSAPAFYDPTIGRWASRDPIGEIGAETLYSFEELDLTDGFGESNPNLFVLNDPINLFDRFGLAVGGTPADDDPRDCACVCKEVIITFEPGGKKPKAEWYVDNRQYKRFGAKIKISWKVEGDPKKCRYYLMEPAGGVSGSTPTTKESSTGTGGVYVETRQEIEDNSGIGLFGHGKYKVKYDLYQTYKCVGADRAEMVVGPKHYTGSFSSSYPPKK